MKEKILDAFKEKRPEHSFDFKLSDMVGRVEYLFADEELEVKKGHAHYIKIKSFTIPPHWLIVPCSYIQHPLGKAIGVGERFAKPVELKRYGTYAVFTASADGRIKKGDLVGAVVMLFVRI